MPHLIFLADLSADCRVPVAQPRPPFLRTRSISNHPASTPASENLHPQSTEVAGAFFPYPKGLAKYPAHPISKHGFPFLNQPTCRMLASNPPHARELRQSYLLESCRANRRLLGPERHLRRGHPFCLAREGYYPATSPRDNDHQDTSCHYFQTWIRHCHW